MSLAIILKRIPIVISFDVIFERDFISIFTVTNDR